MDVDIKDEEKFEEDNIENQDEEQIKIKIRLGFIRKVYGIIFIQVLITTICTYFAVTKVAVSSFLINNPNLWIIAFIGLLATEIPIICCRRVARKVPINYILLLIFTLCESYFVVSLTLEFEPMSVLLAAGLTVVVVLGLTIYAMFTKSDITLCGGTLFVFSLLLLILSIVGIFFRNYFFQTLIDCLGLLLFSAYLIYDIQMLIGNKSKKFSEDDYIFAALQIYLDIIYLFLKIMKLFGKKKK